MVKFKNSYLNNLGISFKEILKEIQVYPGILETNLVRILWDKYDIKSKGYLYSTAKVYIFKAVQVLAEQNIICSKKTKEGTIVYFKNSFDKVIKCMWFKL